MAAPTRPRTRPGSAYLPPSPADGAGTTGARGLAIVRQPAADAGAAGAAGAAGDAAGPQAGQDLLAQMSHELRTPLNAVIGYATLVRANAAGRLDEQDLQYLDRIIAQGLHLLGVVGDVLDVTRIAAGRLKPEMVRVPLAPLVRTALAGVEARASVGGVAVVAELPRGDVEVETDMVRLPQVIATLAGIVVDAFGASAASGCVVPTATVVVAVDVDERSGRPLRIRVAGSGGAPAGDARQAAQQAAQQAARGAGLGLETARALCGLMGYRLAVSGGHGAAPAFSIELEA